MNASVSTFRPTMVVDSSAGRAEHISMETTELDITTMNVRQPYRKVRETYVLKSALRRCTTELSLLDEDYLKVRVQRAGTEDKKYTLDLRFLNSQPLRTRKIAWSLVCVSAALLVVTLVAMYLTFAASGSMIMQPTTWVACGTGLAAVVVGIFALRATTESLSFTSVHGGAPLVTVSGGLGSTKNGKAFFVLVIKSIAAAKTARQQAKPQLLRDEMREHHRLREMGVISEADYEASKAKILRAHS